MRHSDSKLTERIYTDRRMLATWSAIEKPPSYTAGPSQTLVANCLGPSSAAIEIVGAHVERMPAKIGESHLVSVDGTMGKLAGVTELERLAFCDVPKECE